MPHEDDYLGSIDDTSQSASAQTTPGHTDSANPFMQSDVTYVAKKISENVGNPELDRIRSITFTSLVKGDPFDELSGARRAIQILYSCGKGHFITHAFGFTDDFFSSLRADSEPISGKPLKEIIADGQAHDLLYRQYLKIYSQQKYYNPDLVNITKDIRCFPQPAEYIVKLLLLLVLSIRLEG